MDVAEGGARGMRRGIVATGEGPDDCVGPSPVALDPSPLEILSFLRARPEASGGSGGNSMQSEQRLRREPGALGVWLQGPGQGHGGSQDETLSLPCIGQVASHSKRARQEHSSGLVAISIHPDAA